MIRKKAKNRRRRGQTARGVGKKNRFSAGGMARKLAIVPNYSNYLKRFCNFTETFKKNIL